MLFFRYPLTLHLLVYVVEWTNKGVFVYETSLLGLYVITLFVNVSIFAYLGKSISAAKFVWGKSPSHLWFSIALAFIRSFPRPKIEPAKHASEYCICNCRKSRPTLIYLCFSRSSMHFIWSCVEVKESSRYKWRKRSFVNAKQTFSRGKTYYERYKHFAEIIFL
ncbi:LANO_0G06920g1_1 [Lachancea nothofagi CBS 11611]|uniref:LANO_0G06920g1_1 n=1 Tax=Lachancea nothofagi CBS 11611 TaxID=1266666 RepID=A0A1G4KH72_9SACH|nr:LANO_0G06920g1_1 [Lachancea nothofagi CBS 11611]